MSYLTDLRSSERRFRSFVCTDLGSRAPEALRNIERNVPPAVLDAAFEHAWDRHQADWQRAYSSYDFDFVAEEASVTVMHYLVDALRAGLSPVEARSTASPA